MEEFIKKFGIEYLIQHQDSLNILQDLTSCPKKLELIDLINNLAHQDFLEVWKLIEIIVQVYKLEKLKNRLIKRNSEQDGNDY